MNFSLHHLQKPLRRYPLSQHDNAPDFFNCIQGWDLGFSKFIFNDFQNLDSLGRNALQQLKQQEATEEVIGHL